MAKVLTILMGIFLSFGTFADSGIVLNESNTITIDTHFTSRTTSNVAQRALELSSKLRKDEPLYLVIDSGGGGIQAGLEMISNLNSLNRPVHTICVFCASMAFQTIQGLSGDRILIPFGTMMSHKARGGFGGEFPGQIDSRLSYYKRRLKMIDLVTVNRTNKIHTLESYEALYENEYWCDGVDCISQGFSDKISNISCDQSLSSTKIEELRIPVRGKYGLSTLVITFEKSQCPVITGILSTTFELDGQLFNWGDIEELGMTSEVKTAIQNFTTKHRTPKMYFEKIGN